MRLLQGVFALSLAAGCGGSESIDATALAGTIDDQPWTFRAGHTSAFLSDTESFFATLYPETFEACGFGEPDGPHLILSIPTKPGDYDLGLSLNMTFVFGDSENVIGLDGHIVVDEVTATSVRGGIVASADGGHYVNGQFNVSICVSDDQAVD